MSDLALEFTSVEKVIHHEGNKWILYSHDGSKKLGEFDTEEAALKREQQINYFKHVAKSDLEMEFGMVSQPVVEVEKAGNGIMIAWFPSKELADKLAREGGELSEELHVTLAYLGKDLTEGQVGLVKETVEAYCKRLAPLQGTVAGTGRFPATPSSDYKDVLVQLVDIPRLELLREELIEMLADKGIPTVRNHGYTPHMTLAYVDPDYTGECVHPDTDDIAIDALTVAVGGERYVYPLNGEEVLKSNECHVPSGPTGGEFCSGGSSGSGDVVTNASDVKLFRASAHEDLRAASGGYTALGEGTYFGVSAEDVKGYGPTVREYSATGKLLNVQGDKGYDKYRQEAQQWGQEKLKQADWTTPEGIKSAVALSAPSSVVNLYLQSKGYVGVHYHQVDRVNDHHTQVVVFDPSKVKAGKVSKMEPTASQVHSDKPLTDEEKKRKQVKKSDLEVEFNMEQESIDLQGEIVFKVADRQQVFGWASVISKNENGIQVPIADTQGDVISADELEKMAYSFVLDSRIGGEMHVRKGVGKLIESVVLTVEKAKAMGIELPGGVEGWWTGWAISDDEVWSKIKKGEYTAFSIHGKGLRSKISE